MICFLINNFKCCIITVVFDEELLSFVGIVIWRYRTRGCVCSYSPPIKIDRFTRVTNSTGLFNFRPKSTDWQRKPICSKAWGTSPRTCLTTVTPWIPCWSQRATYLVTFWRTSPSPFDRRTCRPFFVQDLVRIRRREVAQGHRLQNPTRRHP